MSHKVALPIMWLKITYQTDNERSNLKNVKFMWFTKDMSDFAPLNAH